MKRLDSNTTVNFSHLYNSVQLVTLEHKIGRSAQRSINYIWSVGCTPEALVFFQVFQFKKLSLFKNVYFLNTNSSEATKTNLDFSQEIDEHKYMFDIWYCLKRLQKLEKLESFLIPQKNHVTLKEIWRQLELQPFHVIYIMQ